MPTTKQPIIWSMKLDVGEPGPGPAAVVFGIWQSTAAKDDGACFLDIQKIGSIAKGCTD